MKLLLVTNNRNYVTICMLVNDVMMVEKLMVLTDQIYTEKFKIKHLSYMDIGQADQ